jgi:1,4-alpha-glucan branching enzyme
MGDRRTCEKSIAYCESHDQSIVGDVPLAQLLMGPHMPKGMAMDSDCPQVARGMALHKLIRFITFALGGEGWLSFIGNEFGHPDWVDFPREGNGFTYDNALRKWSLVDDPKLKYQWLNAFDRALQALDESHKLLASPIHETVTVDDLRKTIVARRAGLLFVFNFHPTNIYECFEVPGATSTYRIELSSVATCFGSDDGLKILPATKRSKKLMLRLPPRSGACLAPCQA